MRTGSYCSDSAILQNPDKLLVIPPYMAKLSSGETFAVRVQNCHLLETFVLACL